MDKIKVVVISQEDKFNIPRNIKLLKDECEILGIVRVKHKAALEYKIKDFIKWFGMLQVSKLGFKVILRQFQSYIDKISRFRVFKGECSLRDVAKYLKVRYFETKNVNSKEFIKLMEELKPELIISYSAPQVFKEKLLSIPPRGVINVHGSYLPEYRGCLPSFWQLYKNEKYAGATVHYMNEKIDDGDIIVREKVDISNCKSVFEVINLTKQLGGRLLVQAVKKIKEGNFETIKNDASAGQYYSWPTIEDAKNFRKQGKRLI